jgi:ABC-2 type transport system ATP-binding protein
MVTTKEETMNVIQMLQVSKRYGGTQALNNMSLEVAQGEVVAFLGPNGAGKTTALQVMLGLREASSGTVKLFGLSPQSKAAKTRVGVMLQECDLPETLTVEELVNLFRNYYPYTLPTDDVLKRADLLSKRSELVRQLSGGQKQRLYFALSIVGDPDLIFLDEPTVAMDVEARRSFWEQVRDFANLGKTILFSTHYLEEADAIADRIVVIHQGQIIKDGSPHDIKRLVAAKTVKLKTDVWLEQAQSFPAVERATQDNGYLTIYSNEPEKFISELIRKGHTMTDLTVTDTDLEAAFVSLTQKQTLAGGNHDN